MQFAMLGALEVVHDGRRVPLGGVRQRVVLARLLVDGGRVVPTDRLIEDVWDARPPATARKTLQKYVYWLRRALRAPVLRTAGPGYVLDVDDEALDARRFERLLAAGNFAAAPDVWQGEVLADLPDIEFVVAERTRLGELRLVALEQRLQADLDAGRHSTAVAELAELVEAHP